jgi:hypothetical protein
LQDDILAGVVSLHDASEELDFAGNSKGGSLLGVLVESVTALVLVLEVS